MTRHSLIRKANILALALSATISGLVQAQDSAQDTSTVVYQADYFAEYAPVTAQDMLDRIPGMSASSGGSGPGGVRGSPSNSRGSGGGGAGGRRGLGDGGGGNQILINGKRTAGKNNQASTQLNRIAAGQVDYIEIIRGTSGDLDVRGSGQVINVVLFEDLSTYRVFLMDLLAHRLKVFIPSFKFTSVLIKS